MCPRLACRLVVLCPPRGAEASGAGRAMRGEARQAGRQGRAFLRFATQSTPRPHCAPGGLTAGVPSSSRTQPARPAGPWRSTSWLDAPEVRGTTGMPNTQPAWYAETGVFLTLPCPLGARSGDPGSTAAWPEADTEREDRRAAYSSFPSHSCPSEASDTARPPRGLPGPQAPSATNAML